MRKNMLSRRAVVYAILLVAVFLLLALVLSGCITQGGEAMGGGTHYVSRAELQNPKPLILSQGALTGGPDGCTPLGRPTIKVVRQAAHGRVLVTRGTMEICENGNMRLAPSTDIEYLPNKGFLGRDTFSYVTINPDGTSQTADVTLYVRLLN